MQLLRQRIGKNKECRMLKFVKVAVQVYISYKYLLAFL